MSNWFIPEIEDFPVQRALLHLGLNSDLRYYRELLAPGIAGVWYVRQLSWSVAGIYLAKELNLKPAKVANAIEALAEKLEWYQDNVEFIGRGKRAFARDKELDDFTDDTLSYNFLSDKKHYVQVTYRQSTVSALNGLGLSEGTRFNTMNLTPAGEELAKYFLLQKKGGKGKKSVYSVLSDWLQGISDINKSGIIREGIGKNHLYLDNAEKEICRYRLTADSNDKIPDPKRRIKLINAFKDLSDFDIKTIKNSLNDHPILQKDIETALCFDAMLEAARLIIHNCAQELQESNSDIAGIQTGTLAKSFKNKLTDLIKKCEHYKQSEGKKRDDAGIFSQKIIQSKNDLSTCLASIIQRDGNILRLSGDRVVRGNLFEHFKEISGESKENEIENTQESSVERKIRQLYELWRDCQ